VLDGRVVSDSGLVRHEGAGLAHDGWRPG